MDLRVVGDEVRRRLNSSEIQVFGQLDDVYLGKLNLVMRVATLNVSTLHSRLDFIIKKCLEDQVDLICVQEARVGEHSWGYISRRLREHKFHAIFGKPGKDTRGSLVRGCTIFSRWPAAAVAWEHY